MKKIASFNGCKAYDLSTGKTMPQWLSESKKRALAKDEDYRRRLELIQDFEMPTASQSIKMTRDGEHIIVTGTYPPIVKCYTVSDMALKFQRGLTCEVVAFETLSDDYGKLVFLQADRTLNFHAPYGTHFSLRVPKFGRDLKYNWDTCDLYVSSSGQEVYRLNLEYGQFKEPLLLGFAGCNKIDINPTTPQLLGCGGENAICEFWDLRSRKVASRIRVDPTFLMETTQVTALKFDTDGLTLGVGTSNGNCILYDIRSSRPIYTKEHQYGLPIIDVAFHNGSGSSSSAKRVISTDKKLVKIWERGSGDDINNNNNNNNTGKILTNIETPSDINGVHVVEDRRGKSGLIMLAGEQSRVMSYFVPQLGPAPRWCSFLENLTEELEETVGQSVYEDYKFVTRTELEEMGATGLIGTPMLRGYMHGFFLEMKLYSKLRAVSKPFEFDEHRKKRIQDKIEANRQSRIAPQKRLPKVNKLLAEKLMKLSSNNNKKDVKGDDDDDDDDNNNVDEDDENNDKNNDTDKSKTNKKGLIDSRFADLFKREEFEMDPNSTEFKLRNPSSGHNQRNKNGDDSDDDLENMFEVVDEDEDEDEDDDDDDGDGGYGDDNNDGWDSDLEQIRADSFDSKSKKQNKNKRGRNNDDDDDEGQIIKASKKALERRSIQSNKDNKNNINNSNSKTKSTSSSSASTSRKVPKMYEIADGISGEKVAFHHTDSERSKRQIGKAKATIPMYDRMASESISSDIKSKEKVRYIKSETEGLIRELSFFPSNNAKDVKKGDKLDTKRRVEMGTAEDYDESFNGGGKKGNGKGKGKGKK